MLDVSVRPLSPGDHDRVSRLWFEAWHDAHGPLAAPHVVEERTLDTFRNRLDELQNQSQVAVVDGEPIAFGALVDGSIDQFYVARSFRGLGVAKLFLSVLEDKLAARGVVDGLIECMKGNARAYAFYAKSGWTDRGVVDLPLWTGDGRVETVPTHRFTKRLVP